MMECVSKKGEFDPARFLIFEFVEKSRIVSFLVLNPLLCLLTLSPLHGESKQPVLSLQ